LPKKIGVSAGKATLGLAAARQLVACAHWENAYWADMAGAVSAAEAAFQLLSGAITPSLFQHCKQHNLEHAVL
jgi:hypothetical protein